MYKRQEYKSKKQNKNKSPHEMTAKFKTNAEIKQVACFKKIFRTSLLGDACEHGLEHILYSPISVRLD